MNAFHPRRAPLTLLPAFLGAATLLAGCSGSSLTTTPSAATQSHAVSTAGAVARNTVFPPVQQPGPAVYVYKLIADGFTDPTGGQVQPDPATFNAQSNAFGAATPQPVALTSRSSTFGGSAGNPLDLTEQRFSGTAEIPCRFFQNQSTDGYCPSSSGANKNKGTNVHAWAAVQTWPFYVGDGASANLGPGTYTFETDTQQGSWIVLAPSATTYAQPGDFAGTSGLVSGTALVNNGGIHALTSTTGGVFIGAETCTNSLYWGTLEYFSALGGNSAVEYSWEPPGASTFSAVDEGVLWGQVTHNGVPVAGEAITITMGSVTTPLVSDAGGCYGFNLPAAAHIQRVYVSWASGSKMKTHGATIQNGTVSRLNLAVQ